MTQVLNIGRRVLSANHQLTFRLFKAFIFLGVVATIITLSIICHLSVKDLIVCCLAFLPTGWGFILVSAEYVLPKSLDVVLLSACPIVFSFKSFYCINGCFFLRLGKQ